MRVHFVSSPAPPVTPPAWLGVHGGMSPKVSTFVAELRAATTDSRVMLSGLFCPIRATKWLTATQERKGLLLILSFWSCGWPDADRSAMTCFRIGHGFWAPDTGGSSALKTMCLAKLPNCLMSALPKVPRLTEKSSLELSCLA